MTSYQKTASFLLNDAISYAEKGGCEIAAAYAENALHASCDGYIYDGIKMQRNSDRRMGWRDLVHLPASSAGDARDFRNLSISNISQDGCCFTFLGEAIKSGTELTLVLPFAERVPGKVVWSRGQRAGMRFASPLHSAPLQAIVQQFGYASHQI